MSIVFMDGFDAPGTATPSGELGKKWTVSNSGTGLSFTGGYNPSSQGTAGQALRWASSQLTTRLQRGLWKRFLDNTNNEGVIGFHIRIDSLPASDCGILWFYDEDQTAESRLVINSTGNLEWQDFTTTRWTTTAKISAATWHHIEIYFEASGATRAITHKVAIDESVEDNSGTFNAGAPWTFIKIGPSVAVGTFDIDDFYMIDPQDGVAPTDFIGDVSVETRAVNGDGNTAAWTGVGAGTNDWERIDDALGTDADGDTTYVESTAASQLALFTFEDLQGDVATVHGVAVNYIWKQQTPGGISSRAVQRQSTTNLTALGRMPINDSYSHAQCVWFTDAEESSWTPALVNSAEFGLEGEE